MSGLLLVHNNLIICVLLQASMTGSALSLYLEETKTNEDSLFQSEVSPIKQEGGHVKSNNMSSLSASTGVRRVASRGKLDPSDVLSPTGLALHKVDECRMSPNCLKHNECLSVGHVEPDPLDTWPVRTPVSAQHSLSRCMSLTPPSV